MEKTNKQTLFQALNKAIEDLKPAKKGSTGFKYKYASMSDVLDVANPVLSKHGLAVFHTVSRDEFGTFLKSTLAHVSGDCIDSAIPLVFKSGDMKEMGAALTYARRYAIQAFLNMQSADEEDLDHPKYSAKKASQTAVTTAHEKYQQAVKEFINKKQQTELEEMFALDEDLLEKVLSWLKISDLSDMPASRFNACKTWVEKQLQNPEEVAHG